MTPVPRINRRHFLGAAGAIGAAAWPTASHAAEPRHGGTLNVGFDDDAKTLNPALSIQLSERQVLYLIYDTLLAIDVDFSLKPGLARAWHAENDGRRYVFELQDGVRFHDGTVFDAEAVKWNIEHRLDPSVGSPQRAQLQSVIQSVEVINPGVVAFNLTAPHPALLADLTERPGFMISPAASAKFGADLGRNPVGSGPFKFAAWDQGSSIRLERNATYWRSGLPYLDAVMFRDIPNHVIGLQRLLVGEVDCVTSLSPDDLRQVEGNDGIEIEQARVGRWYSLQYQVDKPPFDNLDLRRAIACALDRKRINQVVMRGRATIANGPTPPGLWWSSPDQVVYDYDPDKARALLKQANIAAGTTLLLAASSELLLRRIDQLVAEQLEAVGLKVELQPVSQAESYARVVQRAINFTPISWTQRSDPDGLLYILFATKGFANTTGYRNPEVDRRLDAARQIVDQDRRKVLYGEVKTLIMQDLPYIPLFFAAEYAAVSKRIHGFVWPPDQIPRFGNVWKDAG
jgi:peptide/nickel transport system substrate-binding protein